jgi:adenine-specific DNA-methyltransferase
LEQKLIIEIDGGQHSEQTEQDARRTAYFETLGFRVLRFWNNEVLGQTDAVLELIHDVLSSPHLTPGPSPRSGEGSILVSFSRIRKKG